MGYFIVLMFGIGVGSMAGKYGLDCFDISDDTKNKIRKVSNKIDDQIFK